MPGQEMNMNGNDRSYAPYTGPASRLHPNTYKGKPQSGGYLARNQQPNSQNSPSFKGRLWLDGVGWFWLSGWTSESHRGKGTYLSLKASPMSDQEADRYCRPKEAHARADRDFYEPPSQPHSGNRGFDDGDIPF